MPFPSRGKRSAYTRYKQVAIARESSKSSVNVYRVSRDVSTHGRDTNNLKFTE